MDQSRIEYPILGNRYKLLHIVGTGGMAVVYRAQDMMLERPVAVKVLREDFSHNQAFRERFHLEARAAANLSHPNIVTVHDFGLDPDNLYLVLEYVPGTDLKTILKERSKLPVNEAVNLVVQASAGIGYAHRAGLIHCDVKPHNMLVTPDFRLKVTDFGIARAMASIQPDEQHDVVWGSPLYFSPEQAAGHAPSPASDVYSLGVVLYELLTGRLPFIASDPAELARLHREVTPVSPRKLNPEIPEAIDEIILKVLSKEPSARYRTADQLGRVLSNYFQQPESQRSTFPSVEIQPNHSASRPINSTPIQLPVSKPEPQFEPSAAEEEVTIDIDWTTTGLALLAIIAVGGLIPFWLWIWFTFNPPTP